MNIVTKLVIKELEELLGKIKSGNCELTEEESMDILKAIAHQSLSKYQACQFLNISTSRFSELMAEGKIPKGRKVQGFNELRWYKDELIPLTRK